MKPFFKKKYIYIISSIILLSLAFWGYYEFIGFEKIDPFAEEIYAMSRSEWAEQTLLKDKIALYNKQTEDKELKNSIQVRILAHKIYCELYFKRGKFPPDEYPYIPQYNEKENAWVVQGTLRGRSMLGGVMYLVLDKATGDILYIAHTS